MRRTIKNEKELRVCNLLKLRIKYLKRKTNKTTNKRGKKKR